jgi:hypothetical protein
MAIATRSERGTSFGLILVGLLSVGLLAVINVIQMFYNSVHTFVLCVSVCVCVHCITYQLLTIKKSYTYENTDSAHIGFWKKK